MWLHYLYNATTSGCQVTNSASCFIQVLFYKADLMFDWFGNGHCTRQIVVEPYKYTSPSLRRENTFLTYIIFELGDDCFYWHFGPPQLVMIWPPPIMDAYTWRGAEAAATSIWKWHWERGFKNLFSHSSRKSNLWLAPTYTKRTRVENLSG